jgi:hypothetical protein
MNVELFNYEGSVRQMIACIALLEDPYCMRSITYATRLEQ